MALRHSRLPVSAAALALLLLALVPARGQAAAASFAPAADAYVSSAKPRTSFGYIRRLRVDGSPRLRSYIRFDVQGLSGRVAAATLTLMPTSNQSHGIVVRSVQRSRWHEGAITYRNAPAMGSSLGSSGSVRAGAPISIDVTGAVAGDGTVTFGLTSSARRALALYSRERPRRCRRGACRHVPFRRPRLEVVTSAGAPGGTSPGSGASPFAPASSGSDPVVAAAGDIACDPASSSFNSGNGTAANCRQRDVAETIGGA